MIVYDIDGNEYEINVNKPIGQGGQGAVFKVVGNNKIVLKCQWRVQSENIDIIYSKYSEKINEIIALTLPEGIAVPEVVLNKPQCGYVMRFMEDMVPIEELFMPQNDFRAWYLDVTGGYERRLKIALKLAMILGQLHNRGLVYSDLSPGNVFVSKNVKNHEVWLIDADNIHYQNDNMTRVCTNLYNAPELLNDSIICECRGKNSIKADVYSFAILVYQLLTATHPFLGKLDYDSDLEDWENDVRERISLGLVPWINDETDVSNSSDRGLPFSIMDVGLRNLFIQTFESGRLCPEKRPTINQWIRCLQESIDNNKIMRDIEADSYYKVQAYNVYLIDIDGKLEKVYKADDSETIFFADGETYITNRIARKKYKDNTPAVRIQKEYDDEGKNISYKIIPEIQGIEIRENEKKVFDGVASLETLSIITDKTTNSWREIQIRVEE